MKDNINLILESIANKEGTTLEDAKLAITDAISKGISKKHNNAKIIVKINKKNEFEIFKELLIIDDEMEILEKVSETFSNERHIFLDIAEEKFPKEKNLKVGDFILEPIENNIQSQRSYFEIAKSFFMARMKELKVKTIKESLDSEYNNLFLIKILSFNRNHYKVDLIIKDNVIDGVLPINNILHGEKIEVGKKYFASVDMDSDDKYKIVFTRKSVDFIKEVLKKEIYLIQDQIITIQSIHIANNKISVLVKSSDKRISPVSMCVGTKGILINNIKSILGNKPIEIFEDTSTKNSIEEYESSLIKNIFKIKENENIINKIIIENKETIIVLEDNHYEKYSNNFYNNILGLFLNKKINITSTTLHENKNIKSIEHFMNEINMDNDSSEFLVSCGFKTIYDIAPYTPKEFAEDTQITIETAEELIKACRNKALEIEKEVDKLNLNEIFKDFELSKYDLFKLSSSNIKNVDDLADLSSFELMQIIEISKDNADKIILKSRNL